MHSKNLFHMNTQKCYKTKRKKKIFWHKNHPDYNFRKWQIQIAEK